MKKRSQQTNDSNVTRIADILKKKTLKDDDNQHESLKTQKRNLCIQLGIGIALVGTLAATIVSIYKQSAFQHNALRPWIACEIEPSGTLGPMYIDATGKLRFKYYIVNHGNSPARDVITVSAVRIDTVDDYPEKFLKWRMQAKPKQLILFPGQKLPAKSEQMDVIADITEIDTSQIDTLSGADSLFLKTENEIHEALIGQKIFAYIYTKYLDLANEPQYLRTTYLITFHEKIYGDSVYRGGSYNIIDISDRSIE